MREFLIGALLMLLGLVGTVTLFVTCDSHPRVAESSKLEAPVQEQLVESKYNLTVGNDLTIILYENPSKKLKWIVESQPDFLVLEDENKKTLSETLQSRRFLYRAKALGEGWLTFAFKHGWESNAPVVSTVKYHIVVTK